MTPRSSAWLHVLGHPLAWSLMDILGRQPDLIAAGVYFVRLFK